MDRMETQKIINKIKTFRQSFLVERDTVDNWLNVLKDYDYKDVDEKLDEYFRESKNFGQYPDPYYLTKYLIKSNEKFSMSNITIKCSLCGKTVLQDKYQEHYDRCSSVDYVIRMNKRFYHRSLNRYALEKLPDNEFEEMYWRFCYNLYEIMPEGLEKRCLENAIRSYKGMPINYHIDEILENL